MYLSIISMFGAFIPFCGLSQSTSEEEYLNDQKTTMNTYKFDDSTASIILVPGFSKILKNIHCPVMAIFGEKDSQVDWQKTMNYYKHTIGTNPESKPTIKTFPNCNHMIQKRKTGGMDEEDWMDSVMDFLKQ